MAKTSGSIAKKGGFTSRDSDYKGSIGKLESLVKIKNPAVYKSVKDSIARYHSVMGVRQREVKLGEIGGGALGVHVTSDGKSLMVVLNKSTFNKDKNSITKTISSSYKSGFLTATNKPIAHVVTHELAHATWNSHLAAPNAKAAGKEIEKVYKVWTKSRAKSGYGKYATTNMNEYFAETATRAVHGKSDIYTKKIKSIVKKYKL